MNGSPEAIHPIQRAGVDWYLGAYDRVSDSKGISQRLAEGVIAEHQVTRTLADQHHGTLDQQAKSQN
ncbi:MAG: hypothetical protein ACR2NZ_15460 [Rubripirellula sp.]